MTLDAALESVPAHSLLMFALLNFCGMPSAVTEHCSSPSFPMCSCFSSSRAGCQQLWQSGRAQSGLLVKRLPK